jgi:hypothetical protein
MGDPIVSGMADVHAADVAMHSQFG